MAGDDDDQQLSEYELQRQQRIASNRAKMAELQLEELAHDVQQDAQQHHQEKQAEKDALRQALVGDVANASPARRPVRRARAAAQHRIAHTVDDGDDEVEEEVDARKHVSDDEYDPLDELRPDTTNTTAARATIGQLHPLSSGDTSSLSPSQDDAHEEEGQEGHSGLGASKTQQGGVLGTSKLQQKQQQQKQQQQQKKQKQQQRQKQQQSGRGQVVQGGVHMCHMHTHHHPTAGAGAAGTAGAAGEGAKAAPVDAQVIVVASDDDEDLQRALLMSMQDAQPQQQAQQPPQPTPTHNPTHAPPTIPHPPTQPSTQTKPAKPAKPAKPTTTKSQSRGKKRQRALSENQLATVFAVLQRGGDLIGRSHITYAAQQLELHLTEEEVDVMIARVQEHTGGGRMLTYDTFCTLAEEVL